MTAALDCPRCHVALYVGHTAGGSIHGCGRCGGIWIEPQMAERIARALDPSALALAESAERHAAHLADTATPLTCPTCRAGLYREHVAQARVDIDWCAAHHGTWFDRGELGKVAQALSVARAYGGAHPIRAGSPSGLGSGALLGAAAAAGTGVLAGAALAHAGTTTLHELQHRARTLDAADTAEIAIEGAEIAIEGAEIGVDGLAAAADMADAADAAGGAVELAGGAFELFGSILGALGDIG